MDKNELFGAIESVLFVSGEPLPKAELARVFDMTPIELEAALANMESELAAASRGIRLYSTDGTVQLVTAPEYNDYLIKLLAPPEERELSDSMMETLSVIAYRQPVTRADVEAVRGVRCDYAVTQLLKQGFIKELGRKNVVGRPMLFGTTDAFLRRFGLKSIADLPPLPQMEEDDAE